jgi:hypothetical protein
MDLYHKIALKFLIAIGWFWPLGTGTLDVKFLIEDQLTYKYKYIIQQE